MDLRDIHVCISAYACDPTRGSEPGIGWNIVREVARRHRVWAVTRRKNEAAIAAALRHEPLPNLRIVYVDLPKPLLAFKRGQIGIETYYGLWQRLIRSVLAKLHREVHFDVVQHATFGRYWGPTALAYAPAPFVWGPVGGGESAPATFRDDLDWHGRVSELIRDGARRCGESAPSVRRAARRATLALAVTEETKARLLALGTKRVELFSAMGMDAVSYRRFCEIPIAQDGGVRFISMGRLLHWKGFHLGLKAFAAADVPDAEYWIVGDGPERLKLIELATRLGIANRVRFWGAQRWNDALQTLAACHVLVHPSLHDSGGFVCLEAMAAGKPVLCLDLGGPAEQVTPLTGVKVAAITPEQAVSDLAHAMTELGNTRDLRHVMGEEGRRRVKSEYIWDTKGDRLDALYESVLDATAVPARSAL